MELIRLWQIERNGDDIMGVLGDAIRVMNAKEVRDAIADFADSYDEQVINVGNSNAEIVAARVGFNQLNDRLDSMQADNPKGIYSTLADLQTAYPTGTNGKFIVGESASEKHWYVWLNSQWTDGGVYQGIGIANESISYKNISKENLVAISNLNTNNLFKSPLFTEENLFDWVLNLDVCELDDINKIDGYNTIKITRDTEHQSNNMFWQSIKNLLDNTEYYCSIKYKLDSSQNIGISVLGYKNNAFVATIINTSSMQNASEGQLTATFTSDNVLYDEYRIVFSISDLGEVWFANPLLILNSEDIKSFAIIDELLAKQLLLQGNIDKIRFNPNNISSDYGEPVGWTNFADGCSYDSTLLDGFKTIKARKLTNSLVPFKVINLPQPYTGNVTVSMKVKVVKDAETTYPTTIGIQSICYPAYTGSGGSSKVENLTINEDGEYELSVTQDYTNLLRVHACFNLNVFGITCYINQLTVVLDEFKQEPNAEAMYKKVAALNKDVGDLKVNVSNPLYNKIVVWNGDSIGQAVGEGGGGYAKVISDSNNMTSTNYCIGGGTITAETYYDGDQYIGQGIYGTARHWVSRDIANMDADADYIILEGGINDYWNSVPLGTITPDYISSFDDTTFCGAFESMLKQALLKWQGKKIGFIITHKITNTFYPYGTATSGKYELFRQKIIEICEKWSVPYLDLFNISGLNSNIPEIKSAYFCNGGDGIHPNLEGYTLFYVPKIEAWMRTL